MNDKHVLEILDRQRFAELSENELRSIRIHSAECADCRQAFEAALVSSVLLNIRAGIPAAAPPPFFEAKVLNAIREKQHLLNPIAAFWRWWQASYPLVCSMLFIVLTLVGLTFFAPRSKSEEAVSTYNLYSADAVILNQKPPRNLTTEQTLEVIYAERRDFIKR